LRDVSAVQEFLEGFPGGLPDDVPWLSMLADLEFGPLNRPQKGAQVCRQILKIVPDHKESHQRLVFFYAMTQQQMAMQEQVEMLINSQSALPEERFGGHPAVAFGRQRQRTSECRAGTTYFNVT
jgi:hypothetical protein